MELTKLHLYISVYIWTIFLVLSGGFYLLQSNLFDSWFPKLKIIKKSPSKKQIKLEIKNSIISLIIINITGVIIFEMYHRNMLQINSTMPTGWLLIFTLQFFLMHTLHDAYFYWTHRWMHEIKWMRRWHHAHHQSHVPTPFSAFNFSWQEASIHALFFFLSALLLPINWIVFSYFYAFLFWINVFGHMNFDFWPQGLYRWPYGSLFMTPTHHGLHHEYNVKNYGLYYRFWDDLCGTMNSKSYPHFYSLKKEHRPTYTTQIPSKRPTPQETIGLYFEQIEQFGEDALINWDVNGINHTFHHSGDDGTSSFNELLKLEDINCQSYPTYTTRPKLNFIQKVFSIIRLYSRIPHLCGTLKKVKPKNSPKQFFSLYFSHNETKKILEKTRGVGVNAYFIHELSTILSPQISRKKQMWMAPVNTNLPGESVANEVSNVDIIFNPQKKSKSEIKKMIQREIDSGMIFSGKFLFRTLNILGRAFFTTQAWLSQYLLKRTGCFSNLGRFKLDRDISMSFCPPPQRGSCFACGLITINDRFCLRVGIHRQVDIDMELLRNKIKESLLS